MEEVFAVIRELRTHLTLERFRELYREGYPDGYRLCALSDEGAWRAAAGYRLGVSLANGRYLYVDDLVTAEVHRSSGYGKALLDHLVALAREQGCDCVTLDSGVHRYRAHRFYMREGFAISSHHFYRGLVAGAKASYMREEP